MHVEANMDRWVERGQGGLAPGVGGVGPSRPVY